MVKMTHTHLVNYQISNTFTMRKHPIYITQQTLFEVGITSQKQTHKEKSESSYIFDIVDALSAPVLTYSPQWADVIPKRMFDIIPLSRMTALMKKEELATYAECVVYMYTRSLEAPMNSEWTDIYTHISCKTLNDWFGENQWEEVKAPKVLTEWLRSKLNGLRRHIYDKRREILKQKLRDQEKVESELTIDKKTSSVIAKQQSLFQF